MIKKNKTTQEYDTSKKVKSPDFGTAEEKVPDFNHLFLVMDYG